LGFESEPRIVAAISVGKANATTTKAKANASIMTTTSPEQQRCDQR
jgi:hypothetical protein